MSRLLLLAAAVLATGCASVTPVHGGGRKLHYSPRFSSEDAPRQEATSGEAAPSRGDTQEDGWEQLLSEAGLEAQDERPLAGSRLTPTQAARLLEVLLSKPVTLGTFPARMGVGYLLRGVLEQGVVSRRELLRRVARFTRVAVRWLQGRRSPGSQGPWVRRILRWP